MFSDYRTFIIDTYTKKRSANELRPNLLVPNPSKLRAECELVYQERYSPADDAALKMFFGIPKEGQAYADLIRRFDVTKFKPLVNFLTGKIKEPEDKNVELLAWLMDIEQRPYRSGQHYTLSISKEQINSQTVKTSPSSKNKRIGIVALLIIVATGMSIYVLWPKHISGQNIGYPIPPPLTGKCMAWDQDHYIVIPCEQQATHDGVLGIDSSRLIKFRRINDTSSISENSIGRVWYFKKKGHLEYYTSAGYHPLDTGRWLRPITTYIIRKYLHHQIH